MSKNMIDKAREAVDGFAGLYERTEQRLSLTGYSGSTSENYLRELARITLQFGTIPDNLAEEQINSYLQGLTDRFTKQQGTFKMAVWGPHRLMLITMHSAGLRISELCFGYDYRHLSAATGMTAVLHTWGQTLVLHPHLHCIVPAGGLTVQGKWRHTLSVLWRGKNGNH